MKWYKHIADSLDDPFIFGLMEEFGHTGYVVFFGVLEIYAREFSVKDDWKLTEKLSFYRHKLRISRSRFKKVLSKIDKWDVEFSGEYVSIFIPKFKELMDESTLKKLRAIEKSFRNHSGIIPKSDTTDVDVDVDVDVEEDKELSTSCSEPEKTPGSEPEKIPIFKILLIKKDGEFLIFQEDVDQWQETFPGIDVLKELREIKLWNFNNPKKRKTKSGIRTHISFWMAKEQNRGGKTGNQSPHIPKATTVYQADMLQKEAVNQEYLRQRRQDEESDSGYQDAVDIENSPKAIN